jgi:hypothetical protein
MCHFASFVLTKNDAYYLDNSDSHEDIIEYFNLKDDSFNLVRVELIPPKSFDELTDADLWTFHVDQDFYPDWTYNGDPTLQQISRKALAKRIQKQKIGHISDVGDSQKILTGDYSKNIVGDYSCAFSSHRSICRAGKHGLAVTTNNSTSIAGDWSVAFSSLNSRSVAGDLGTAFSGPYGISIAGKYGYAISGHLGCSAVGESGHANVSFNGKAKAGINGCIQIAFIDKNSRTRYAIGYVGEDGILPDTFYKVENGKLVIAE